jgi:hypothetical protein
VVHGQHSGRGKVSRSSSRRLLWQQWSAATLQQRQQWRLLQA